MIGNDVVDLVLARKESNWKRKGFLNKLFTTVEQEFIQKYPKPEEMVWMLWSIKESTYKAYQRIHFNEGYYPIKIEVIKITAKKESIVNLFGTLFYGKTIIATDCIKTVVVLNYNDLENIRYLNTNSYHKDKNGLPFEITSNNPISVSHHGRCREIISLG